MDPITSMPFNQFLAIVGSLFPNYLIADDADKEIIISTGLAYRASDESVYAIPVGLLEELDKAKSHGS